MKENSKGAKAEMNEVPASAAKTNDNSAPEFRKVMRGYDPAEVDAYIEELADASMKTSRNFESRMADMKLELTQAKRECETLRAKLKEAESAPAAKPETVYVQVPVEIPEMPAETDGKSGEYEQIIASLKNQLAALQHAAEDTEEKYEAEIRNLRGQNTDLATKLGEAQDACSKAEAQFNDVSREAETLRAENERNAELATRYGDAVATIEKQKSAYDDLRGEKEALASELQVSGEHIGKLETEADALKKDLSRATVENTLLGEKNEQYRNEITALKAESKAKAYEYAEKAAAKEDELRAEITTYRKKLQLQSYHISQADAAITELANQMAQIKSAAAEE